MTEQASKVQNTTYRKTHVEQGRPAFECIALLLQGGGALGAYQAGVYQALSEAQLYPDWVAGISIGAVNAALIAGNPPETRLEKLRQFWECVTIPTLATYAAQFAAHSKQWPMLDLLDRAAAIAVSFGTPNSAASSSATESPVKNFREIWASFGARALSIYPMDFGLLAPRGDVERGLLNQISAGLVMALGAQGFFAPRVPMPWLHPIGSLEATSYYDSAPLKATLERLIDFDRINANETRFSVGAVNVSTGNFVYFDNATHVIGPEHIMASGALPPGFPAIEINGEYYWDGGIVSNTPLQWVLESEPRQDTLAFQVDLWNARGALPRNLAEVETRRKEIQYSSRTRASTDHFKYGQKIRNAMSDLLDKLPQELKDGPEFAVLSPVADRKVYNLVQLIYRSKQYEGDSKDYEFSRQSMEDHWRAGYLDTVRTLRHPEVVARPKSIEGVLTFDLARDGRE
jgi:NTE family protein